MGGTHINQPVVGMAVDSSTGGYWLVAGDGGIFSFGAPFLGSTGSIHLNRPVVGIETETGTGYRFIADDGGVFTFGTSSFFGSLGSVPPSHLVVGITSFAADQGTRSSIQPEAFTRLGMQATSVPSLGRSPFPDRAGAGGGGGR